MAHFSQNHRNNEYRNHRNIAKAQQQIRYHQPFQRLQRRSKFHKLIKERFVQQSDVLKKDNFLLFDAIAKRGGFHEVCTRNRWEEINISMQYDKKMWGLSKYYEQVLLPHEEWLMTHMQPYTLYEHQFVQMHLLAPNNLTAAYYQLTPVEYMFAESNFFSLDEYYNLKTIALFQSEIPQISVQYADKFMVLRRRLLFTQQLKQSASSELKNYGIAGTENKVVIIGLSLSSLIIADTLSQFGIKVIIFDKSRNQKYYMGQKQVIDCGLTLLQGHKGQGSYYSFLNNLDISLQEFSGVCGLLDEEGKLISDQKIRVSQEHFVSIIEELRGQVMSRKKLYEEIVSRVMRRKWEHQKALIRWHYDRYILFNRLKGESTTVADLCTYQSKKFAKHITQPVSIVNLRNPNKLYDRVKQKKNVEIINQPIDQIAYNDGFWNVYSRSDSYTGKYLIYSDQESACKCVLEGNPKLADIGSDIMGESISVLQQLTVLKYINCHYSFRDKVVLKDSLKGMSCFTLNSIHGYIYYFIRPSQNEILAVLRCYHQTSTNYYLELLAIFENRCMAKVNKIVGDQIWSYDYSFSLKDQKYIESLIRIKPNQKMYVMLPITSTHCSHPLQTQIDITTHISSLILDQIYPNYTHYLPSIKNQFKTGSSITAINSATNLSNVPPQTKAIKQQLPVQTGSVAKLPAAISSRSKIQVEIRMPEVQLESLPSQPRLIASKSKKQNQSSFELTKIQSKMPNEEDYDAFGLNNPRIKAYQQKMLTKYKMIADSSKDKLWNATQWFQSQQIEQMQVAQNVLLYSLGKPYLKRKEWFSDTLGIQQKQFFYPIDQMVTRREHLSLKNSYKTTIYYQTILVLKQKIFYCTADENQPQTIYYHTTLNVLLAKIDQAIGKLREEQARQETFRKSNVIIRCKKSSHPPKYLTPTLITKIIQQEISTNQTNLELLLQKKLNSTLSSSYRQRFMGISQKVQLTRPETFASNALLEQLLDLDSRVSNIIAELLNFRDKLSVLAQIKQFSLFELFFGVLNEQYICCEIMNKFGTKPYSYQEIESQDSQLCQQIRQVFSRSVPNEQYSILIVPEPGSVVIYRNFMDRKKQNDFQSYTYTTQQTNDIVRHYLTIGKSRIQFSKIDQILVYILKSLVINHHILQIINNFQEMIKRDVAMQAQLTPKLKLYYRMTKKCIRKVVPNAQIDRFAEKCKELGNTEKQQLAQLMRKNNVKWIENDFVYITK